jgi:D-3-phosphoglycerate dehydrogenase
MKISIYGDRFMKSEIFEEVIKNKLSDHVISFTKKDVEWPDGPFHNDYGKGHFSNIKEYFGNEDDVINTVKDNEILITDLAPITENIINKIPNLKFIGV